MSPSRTSNESLDQIFSRLSSLVKTLEALLPTLFKWSIFLALFLFGLDPQLTNPDVPWHLAQGGWMVHHFQFFRHDVFNYPNINTRIVDEYPLYQIVLWFISCGGDYALALTYSCLLVVLFWIYFRAAERLQFPHELFNFSLLAALVLSVPRFSVRPELLTFIAIAYFMTFLLFHKEEQNWKKFWPLALAQVGWTNTHSGFIIGPALVWGFGGELFLRTLFKNKEKALTLLSVWIKASIFVTLACLVNPYGIDRLALPFFHQGTEVIRAYVTEMQPLRFDLNDFFVQMMVLQIGLIFLTLDFYRGSISWFFLIIALFFFHETLVSSRHLALSGQLALGTVLSSACFGKFRPLSTSLIIRVIRLSISFVLVLIGLVFVGEQIQSKSDLGIASRWDAYALHQTEYPTELTPWMRDHHIEGRLIHRSEIGGWLQYFGYDHGETYSDTGFGKFDENFIHEIGLSCERPDYLPWLLKKYQPLFAVVSCQSYNWPAELLEQKWRCVFYSPSGSLWTTSSNRPDLPTVSKEKIETIFRKDWKERGIPVRAVLLYWELLTLHSAGLSDLSSDYLFHLPRDYQLDPLFWYCLNAMCFRDHPASEKILTQFYQLAITPQMQSSSLLFRAHYLLKTNRFPEVIHLLEPTPQNMLNDETFTILGEAYEKQGRWSDAFNLLRKKNLFDLRNGRHDQLLALAETHVGDFNRATTSWKKALFFFPDDVSVREGISDYLTQHSDPKLSQELKEIERAK